MIVYKILIFVHCIIYIYIMDNHRINMKYIWQNLFYEKYVPIAIALEEIRFADKICQNDYMYILDNLADMIGSNKHDVFVEISVSFSKSTDIIDLLLKEFEIDPVTYVDEWNNTLLMIALNYTTDIDIIKYMINGLKINPHHLGRNFANCLHVACRYNTNLEIIKYLMNDVKVDAMLLDNKGNNCLFEACRENDNIEVIKYLIELNIYDIDSKNNNGANIFVDSTFSNIINYIAIKYIVEKTDVQMDLKRMKFITYNTLLPLITGNHKRLNVLLKKGILMYGFKNLIPFIKTLNPLSIYSEMIRLDVGISDPFDLKYQKFKELVDKLESPVSIQIKQSDMVCHENQISSDSTSNYQEILFVHNNKKYFGNKDIVYKSIILLNDVHFEQNEETIVLSIDVPEYVMDLYVESCYCTYFMIHRLLPEDFVSFIKLIDQYPTTTISIDRNEPLIVLYMMKNNIKKCDYLDNVFQRYCLKLCYMYFSGKLIIDDDSNSYQTSAKYN
jgi:hypothetical protein